MSFNNGATPSDPKRETSFGVWLYFTNGDVIPVAEAMTQWEAHKVAAMLTEARAELRNAQAMRGALAQLPRRQAHPVARSPSPSMVID